MVESLVKTERRRGRPLLYIYTDRTRPCEIRRRELERAGIPFEERSVDELFTSAAWDQEDVEAVAELTVNGNCLPVEVWICG